MIEIYYPFTFLNEMIRIERGNKYQAARIKKDTTNYVMYELMNKYKPFKYPCKLHFTWLLTNKRMDLDNVAYAKKGVIDGIVKAGLLPDDGLKYIIGFTDEFELSDKIGVRIEYEEV
jgi:Holliday junction resolvase RusA-like endonuclease